MKLISLISIQLLFAFTLGACTTKILRPELADKTTSSPQLEDYHDRWFLGFVRKSYTDPNQACAPDTVVKIKDYFSTEDFLLSILTLGIYTPATTQVWCLQQPVASEKIPN